MTKKKIKLEYNFKKGVITDNKEKIMKIISSTDEIYIVKETFYNDGTQSFTIQVHFTPQK